MTEKIRRAAPHDADAAAAILSDGFAADPVMRWVFAETTEAALPAFFRFMVGEALIALGATYLAADGCAVWTPPGCDPWTDDSLGERFMTAMADVMPPDCLGRLTALNEISEGVHPKDPHWYLGMLATRTRAQGTGVGARMLAHTLARVDEEGLPAYLESSNPRNVAFYERHGFTVTGEEWLPEGPVLTLMWRDPRPTQARRA